MLAVVRQHDAIELAHWAGAHAVLLASKLAARMRDAAPDGVDRIVDVAFASYVGLYADVIARGGVIASYFSNQARPQLSPLLFLNTTIRLLGSDGFPEEAEHAAGTDLNTCLHDDYPSESAASCR